MSCADKCVSHPGDRNTFVSSSHPYLAWTDMGDCSVSSGRLQHFIVTPQNWQDLGKTLKQWKECDSLFCNWGTNVNHSFVTCFAVCVSNVSHFRTSVHHVAHKSESFCSKEMNHFFWNRGNNMNHLLFTLFGFVSNVSYCCEFVYA